MFLRFHSFVDFFKVFCYCLFCAFCTFFYLEIIMARGDVVSKSVDLSLEECAFILDSLNLKEQSLNRALKAQIPGSPLYNAYGDMLSAVRSLRTKF